MGISFKQKPGTNLSDILELQNRGQVLLRKILGGCKSQEAKTELIYLFEKTNELKRHLGVLTAEDEAILELAKNVETED